MAKICPRVHKFEFDRADWTVDMDQKKHARNNRIRMLGLAPVLLPARNQVEVETKAQLRPFYSQDILPPRIQLSKDWLLLKKPRPAAPVYEDTPPWDAATVARTFQVMTDFQQAQVTSPPSSSVSRSTPDEIVWETDETLDDWSPKKPHPVTHSNRSVTVDSVHSYPSPQSISDSI